MSEIANKDTDTERVSVVIGLPRYLVRRVRARAAMEDRETADIIASSILEYLSSHDTVEGCGNQNEQPGHQVVQAPWTRVLLWVTLAYGGSF